MSFQLHANLATKAFIIDLPLCQILLEDNSHFPWLFLVPRRNRVAKMMDLSLSDQTQLMQEIDCAQKIVWDLFKPTQLNVAAIGNKTPQLHIHVIARYSTDPAWPATVWDSPYSAPYAAEYKEQLLEQLMKAFATALSVDISSYKTLGRDVAKL